MKKTLLIFHLEKGGQDEQYVEWAHHPMKGDIVCHKQTDYAIYKIHHDLELELTTLHLKKHYV